MFSLCSVTGAESRTLGWRIVCKPPGAFWTTMTSYHKEDREELWDDRMTCNT
jgi:hypothetical protein